MQTKSNFISISGIKSFPGSISIICICLLSCLRTKTNNMFKAPFSFSGRIRRREYALSYVVYIGLIMVFGLVTEIAGDNWDTTPTSNIVFLILFLPCWIFLLAQAVKRSHDLGNSGWFILIPFYGLWLLFADSKFGVNKYGSNPKGIGNEPEFSFEQQQPY